jgi:hypothetical protein
MQRRALARAAGVDAMPSLRPLKKAKAAAGGARLARRRRAPTLVVDAAPLLAWMPPLARPPPGAENSFRSLRMASLTALHEQFEPFDASRAQQQAAEAAAAAALLGATPKTAAEAAAAAAAEAALAALAAAAKKLGKPPAKRAPSAAPVPRLRHPPLSTEQQWAAAVQLQAEQRPRLSTHLWSQPMSDAAMRPPHAPLPGAMWPADLPLYGWAPQQWAMPPLQQQQQQQLQQHLGPPLGGGPQALPLGIDLLGWPGGPAAFLPPYPPAMHVTLDALQQPYPPALQATLDALPPGWQTLVASGAPPPPAPPPLAPLAPPPLLLPDSVRLNWPQQQQLAPQQAELDALLYLTAAGAPPDLGGAARRPGAP